MAVQLEVNGSDDARREAEALRDWLLRDEEFRGRVAFVDAEVPPGELGALRQILTVAAGGAVTALASTIVVWLQTRRSELSVKVTETDGSSFEITAKGPSASALTRKLDLDQ